MFEMPSLVELLGISFMTSFDLPVHFGAAWWYMFVRDAQVRKMPGELWSERRAVIGLDFLNGKGKMLPDFLEKVDGRLGVVVVVDSQHAKPGRFVNGRKLVKALTRSTYVGDELYIELNGAARNLQRCIGRFWPRTILLL